MNLLIIRAINYKNKNKNKKFNNALKAETSEFKFNKDKNKSETKLKKSIKQTDISLSITETEYIIILKTVKNVIITHRILHKLSIILKDFAFLLLINNIDMIAVSESEKVIRNVRHINICYHHIQNLIEKKIIKISHILTDEMTVNDLTKILLSNKFKEFIKLIEISKIELSNNKLSDDKTDDDKFNNDDANNDKNDEKFMTNYYEANKEADKEISFKTEEAE